MKEFLPEDMEKDSDTSLMKVYGRTTKCRNPLTLFWTGSGIELNAKGSELWLELYADYDHCEPWFSIIINGVEISRQMAYRGKNWICIFREMDKNTIKNVRIMRDTQAMREDEKTCLQICRIRFDGEFLPVEERKIKLEVIGDSITSGEGVIGAKSEDDWIPMFFSSVRNYVYMTSESIRADVRILSQSGWGVLCGWDNNPHSALPAYYEKVCGLLMGKHNQELGALDEYDFNEWQPDAVVVHLGTNDAVAFEQPEWKNEITGECFQQKRDDNGNYSDNDVKRFEEAVVRFLEKIRLHNRNAHIVWLYGMLGYSMTAPICRAIDHYCEKNQDFKVTFLQLPKTTEQMIGARSHPGVEAHKIAADILIEELRELLKL